MTLTFDTGLFSGCGGFELGFSRAGFDNLAVAEIDLHACAVLDAHFDSPNLGDVRGIPSLPSHTDVVAAGFPCTDLSQAGRKAGLYGDHSSLALELVRMMIGGAHRPPVIVLENVTNMLSLGKGSAMEGLLQPFESLGYRWAYRKVNAQAWGLPQRRERVLFVLSNDDAVDPCRVLFADDAGKPTRPKMDRWHERAFGFSWTEGNAGAGYAFNGTGPLRVGSGFGIPTPPAIVLTDGRIVTPGIRDAERLQGFDADWTEPADHVGGPGRQGARWRLAGRAIPPVMAEWVAKRLVEQGDVVCPDSKRTIVDGKSWPGAGYGQAGRRIAVEASTYPVCEERPDLQNWLDLAEAKDLSARATKGFLKRYTNGKLKKVPSFICALSNHVHRMETGGYGATS